MINPTYIHPSAVIAPGVTIEPGAYIGPMCVIGFYPEVKGFTGPNHSAIIKAGARLEKAVVVDGGMTRPTIIGNNTMLMSQVHVGHDCDVHESAVISAGATLAGHVTVCSGAYIGVNACIHQFQVIGAHAMIGMGAVLPKRRIKTLVLPCTTWVGNPAKEQGANRVGMERAGLTDQDAYRLTMEYLDTYPIEGEIELTSAHIIAEGGPLAWVLENWWMTYDKVGKK